VNRLSVAAILAVLVFSGRVLDRTTGQGLPHVVVELGNAKTTTDANGRFAIHNPKPGPSNVTVKSDDVPTQRFPINIGTAGAHLDLRVCSTTLDYSCGTPALPNSDGGGSAG
jgi:protocatechuate 3,4-dioxygenase beta subunit